MTTEPKTEALVPMVMPVPGVDIVRRKLAAIQDFQALCRHELRQGQDYGVIPGTDKPTLLKAGAEKIVGLLGLDDDYEVIGQIEDWDKGLFSYTVRCILTDLGSGARRTGLGECNSMEAKYRWRWLWPNDMKQSGLDPTGLLTRTVNTRNGRVMQYRVPNDDPYSLKNTILKMAKKRALVDAALSAGRLSDIFTQDLDEKEPPGPQEESPSSASQTGAAKSQSPKITPAARLQVAVVTSKYPGGLKAFLEAEAPDLISASGNYAAAKVTAERADELIILVTELMRLANAGEIPDDAPPQVLPGDQLPFE